MLQATLQKTPTFSLFLFLSVFLSFSLFLTFIKEFVLAWKEKIAHHHTLLGVSELTTPQRDNILYKYKKMWFPWTSQSNHVTKKRYIQCISSFFHFQIKSKLIFIIHYNAFCWRKFRYANRGVSPLQITWLKEGTTHNWRGI